MANKHKNKIKLLRAASGYSQVDIVHYIKKQFKIEKTYNWVGRTEREEIQLTQEGLITLSKVFNVSTDYILCLTDDPRHASIIEAETRAGEQISRIESGQKPKKKYIKDAQEGEYLVAYWHKYGLPIEKGLGIEMGRIDPYYYESTT